MDSSSDSISISTIDPDFDLANAFPIIEWDDRRIWPAPRGSVSLPPSSPRMTRAGSPTYSGYTWAPGRENASVIGSSASDDLTILMSQLRLDG